MSSMFAWVRPAAIAVLVVGIPSGAIAQAPVSSFDQLATRLRVGDTVYVTDAAGREHKGTIGDLSASSLALLVEKTPRDFPKANVHTIQSQQPDSLANGALIGLAVGAALATAGLIYGEVTDPGYTSAGAVVGTVAVLGGVGAGIGTLIDAGTPGKKVLVYRAPAASPAARVSVLPLVSPRRQGLAVSVRF